MQLAFCYTRPLHIKIERLFVATATCVYFSLKRKVTKVQGYGCYVAPDCKAFMTRMAAAPLPPYTWFSVIERFYPMLCCSLRPYPPRPFRHRTAHGLCY